MTENARSRPFLVTIIHPCVGRHLGMQQSSALHGPGENAHMESFFHSLKAELLHGVAFETDAALRRALGGYFQYYNGHRLHSSLGYRAPVDYESHAA